MYTFEFAPKSTTIALDSTIESGLPIRVWGIIFQYTVAGGTGSVVGIQSGDGTITYFNINMPIGSAIIKSLTIPFIADKGLKFVAVSGDATANLNITVYHSPAGI